MYSGASVCVRERDGQTDLGSSRSKERDCSQGHGLVNRTDADTQPMQIKKEKRKELRESQESSQKGREEEEEE